MFLGPARPGGPRRAGQALQGPIRGAEDMSGLAKASPGGQVSVSRAGFLPFLSSEKVQGFELENLTFT